MNVAVKEAITKSEANRLFNASPWDLMAPSEVVKFQMGCGRGGCMPVETFHSHVNYLLGRVVSDEWLANECVIGWKNLVVEIHGDDIPVMNLSDIVALLPEQYRNIINL